jgi:hypothetical protein
MRDVVFPDWIMLCHKGAEPLGHINITHDGKQYRFPVSRKQIFELAAQSFCALGNMEPGPWKRSDAA